MSSIGLERGKPLATPRGTDLSARRWVSLALWRVPQLLLVIGLVWPNGIGPLWSVAFTWIGGACSANALRCGRVHCAIMGPFFLALGLVSFAVTLGLISVGWTVIGVAALVIILVAFVPEFLGKKYFGADASCET